MLSVAEAFAITQQHLLRLPTESVSLAAATGRVLQEPVLADRDFPPFDRVSMDGIAIRYEHYAGGARQFRIAGAQFAGQPQQTLTDETICLEAMTGAMLPAQADTVVRYEDVTIADGQATILIDDLQPGQNVHHRATDRRAGDELISAGMLLGPSEIAVAASVGRASVVVSTLPRVALISTGDELVGLTETPLPYQIRRSNTYMLRAALLSLGITATLHHIADDELALEDILTDLLTNHDLLILSGGVSAGKADFVPDVLARLGIQKHFHKVDQRPGKPLWFGATEAGQAVFALPGNPVSTVLCACRYVMPFLRASLGLPAERPHYAQLARTILFDPALTYFLPVRLSSEPDGRTIAHPLPGSGSADFANLLDADAFMELPADRSEFRSGEAFRVWMTR
ncbi:molybdenum cofactor synthesis domain protein [Fibrisoma limi BUZ 3]|uniref:Molybdopterin molybdenumtransferase n=1 Tax=Fibrisoma limi BUZ 3 TaxID=1185876 RepID=I2GEI7_9BACT|nr:molybdopterin molybdotransferase MoeA [Fibrisoma limi]CCH52312.1 molybdenum cofactor synthesis domain protein [Fibrisoma limi BUZ 3]